MKAFLLAAALLAVPGLASAQVQPPLDADAGVIAIARAGWHGIMVSTPTDVSQVTGVIPACNHDANPMCFFYYPDGSYIVASFGFPGANEYMAGVTEAGR